MNKVDVLQVLISLSVIIGIALVYEKVFKTNRLLAAIAHALASSAEEYDEEGDWSDDCSETYPQIPEEFD